MHIDKLIRSKRKTLALEITPEAKLVVRAPHCASMDFINQVVAQKRPWIEKNQKRVQNKNVQIIPKQFVAGEMFLYRGRTYPLMIEPNAFEPFSFDNAFKLSPVYIGRAEKMFLAWYKSQALKNISGRVQAYAEQWSFRYSSVKITSAKKRWGSCSTKGALCFSWRIIMAPQEVIDYVVVHELVHLEVKNHSRKFWDRVRFVYPAYRENRKWLKDNGHLLKI